MRKFQVDVNIVELNSTGLMAAIGFSDQLRITQIFMDELNASILYTILHLLIDSLLLHHPPVDCQDVQLSALQRCAILELWPPDGGCL